MTGPGLKLGAGLERVKLRRLRRILKKHRYFLAVTAAALAAAVTVCVILTLRDRQELIVPAGHDAAVTVFTARVQEEPETALIDLNSATAEELMSVRWIGSATAQQIIRFREENGGFTDVTELRQIPGISAERFNEIKEYFTV